MHNCIETTTVQTTSPKQPILTTVPAYLYNNEHYGSAYHPSKTAHPTRSFHPSYPSRRSNSAHTAPNPTASAPRPNHRPQWPNSSPNNPTRRPPPRIYNSTPHNTRLSRQYPATRRPRKRNTATACPRTKHTPRKASARDPRASGPALRLSAGLDSGCRAAA